MSPCSGPTLSVGRAGASGSSSLSASGPAWLPGLPSLLIVPDPEGGKRPRPNLEREPTNDDDDDDDFFLFFSPNEIIFNTTKMLQTLNLFSHLQKYYKR